MHTSLLLSDVIKSIASLLFYYNPGDGQCDYFWSTRVSLHSMLFFFLHDFKKPIRRSLFSQSEFLKELEEMMVECSLDTECGPQMSLS